MQRQKDPRFTVPSVLILILAVLAGPAFSQIGGGLNESTQTSFGGKNFISGTVFLPSGSPINARVTVRLSALSAGEATATTNDQGQFVFGGIGSGSYLITVEADKQFETAVQPVDVTFQPSPLAQTVTVSIRLKEKRSTQKAPPVVQAGNAGVPKRALEHYNRALELAKVGNTNAAIEEMKLAVAAYPTFMLALTELGVMHMKTGDLEKADSYFKSALNVSPDAYEPLVNRGILLVRTRQFDEAQSTLRSALKTKERSDVAHYYLGRALAGLKQYEEAEKEFKTSIEIGGEGMKEAHRMLASLYLETGDNSRAADELEKYLALAPAATDAAKLRETLDQLKEKRDQP